MAYDVLHELQTEAEVKAAGKYKQEGKNYVVQVNSFPPPVVLHVGM